ncbi:MAG: hypothetical protein ACLPYS_08155 [Vulcanimicrobiaceae bacterium]
MSLHRAAKAGSLAFLVAVLAHTADFGSSHLLGGAQGAALLQALWGMLALLGLGALFAGALGPGGHQVALARSSRRSQPASIIALSLGGFAAFCGIEALEGHAPELGPLLALYLGSAAALVAFGSRLLGRWLSELGSELAALVGQTGLLCGRGVVRLRPLQAVHAPRTFAGGVRRGRAPPFDLR